MQDVIDTFSETFSAYLPSLVAALAILVIGWLVAAIIAGKSGIRKVVTVSGAHKPGTLARVAGRLAKAKVNIDSAYLAGQSRKRVTLACGVGKDAAKAKRVLT